MEVQKINECTSFAGIQSGGCGDHAIRLRPALIFQERHADIFLDIFREVLKETK